MNKINGNLHATGGHLGTICMRLAGGHSGNICMGLAITQEVYKRPSLHHNYIFFASSMHASDYSVDGPWIFDLENVLVLSMT